MARQIEDAVVNQGIAGEIIHLNPTRSIEHTLTDASQKGYQTLVVVGDTKTVNKVAARLLRFEMVLGIVPLGDQPALFEKIGVSNWEEAVVALRQRRWTHAPLGHVNNSNIFLTKATIQANQLFNLTVKTDNYTARLNPNSVYVDTRTNKHDEHHVVVHCLSPVKKSSSLSRLWGKLTRQDSPTTLTELSAETVKLETSEPYNIIIDQLTIARTPTEFSIIPKALRLIVKKK